MRQYELTTIWALPKQAWLVNRAERERFGKCVRQWRKENPKANIVQQMLFESLVRLHIWEQRLVDNRCLFNGEKTDRQEIRDHEVDVHSEDLRQKEAEFKEMMPQIMRWKTELLKLALANNVNVDVSGDLSQLVQALDQTRGKNQESI